MGLPASHLHELLGQTQSARISGRLSNEFRWIKESRFSALEMSFYSTASRATCLQTSASSLVLRIHPMQYPCMTQLQNGWNKQQHQLFKILFFELTAKIVNIPSIVLSSEQPIITLICVMQSSTRMVITSFDFENFGFSTSLEVAAKIMLQKLQI